MDFYAKVIAQCKEKGVSRSRMADDIGISRSTPKDWENGKATPRFDTIKKLSNYFGVPVTYFTESSSSIENQTINDNHGIIGTTHAPVTINSTAEQPLGEIEKELLSICGKLDMKRKNALLSKAYELLEDMS